MLQDSSVNNCLFQITCSWNCIIACIKVQKFCFTVVVFNAQRRWHWKWWIIFCVCVHLIDFFPPFLLMCLFLFSAFHSLEFSVRRKKMWRMHWNFEEKSMLTPIKVRNFDNYSSVLNMVNLGCFMQYQNLLLHAFCV